MWQGQDRNAKHPRFSLGWYLQPPTYPRSWMGLDWGGLRPPAADTPHNPPTPPLPPLNRTRTPTRTPTNPRPTCMMMGMQACVMASVRRTPNPAPCGARQKRLRAYSDS